ncbi:MAG: histidine phosphatase family protein [Sulfitobacter sp.]|nr:histidine phosphatase family protein [Sulfitobacter sp.]
MLTLALLRHGHTPWNREGRLQGRTDIPLDDEARAQLAAQALPEGWEDATLWSSPLARAKETAQLVTGRTAQTDHRLIEMNWGDWEGAIRTDLVADPKADYRDIEDWGWDYRPPGGESPAIMRARLLAWAVRLEGRHLAVCHIGVMRVLLAHATRWDFNGPAPFQVKRNRIYILNCDPSGWSPDIEVVRLRQAGE